MTNPTRAAGDRFSNALRSSGAARLLTSYRKHGGGLTESQQDAEVEPPEDAMPETLMNVGHFDVPSSVGPAANIAATFTDGRFRAQVQNQWPALVRYYYGTAAPTDEDDYFIVADGYGVFDFVGGDAVLGHWPGYQCSGHRCPGVLMPLDRRITVRHATPGMRNQYGEFEPGPVNEYDLWATLMPKGALKTSSRWAARGYGRKARLARALECLSW